MDTDQRPKMPPSQIFYGEIVYWVTVVACIICVIGPLISVANPENNTLDPYLLFNAIFEGKTAEEIWNIAGDGFPGGHFYLNNLTTGDGFTQLGLALGCSVALWALIFVAGAYLREKVYLYVYLSLWVALLVFLSMTGLVAGGH